MENASGAHADEHSSARGRPDDPRPDDEARLRDPDRRRVPGWFVAGASALLLGAAVAFAWSAIAPQEPMRIIDGVATSTAADDPHGVIQAQFAALSAAAGLAHGVAVLLGGAARASRTAVLGVVSGLGGAALGWWLGGLMGPASIEAQQDAGVTDLMAPLTLDNLALLLMWPAATAIVLFAATLVSLVVRPARHSAGL